MIREHEYLYEDLTNLIIKAFYKVNNALGYGFCKEIYSNAMLIELTKMGLIVEEKKSIKIF